MANIPKVQKALYLYIPKIDTSIPYSFKYLQKYPASLKFFGQYPCIPKNPSRASPLVDVDAKPENKHIQTGGH